MSDSKEIPTEIPPIASPDPGSSESQEQEEAEVSRPKTPTVEDPRELFRAELIRFTAQYTNIPTQELHKQLIESSSKPVEPEIMENRVRKRSGNGNKLVEEPCVEEPEPPKKKSIKSLKACGKLLNNLFAAKHKNYAAIFYKPVDYIALKIPDYPKFIKKPMDLGTVKEKLDRGEYSSRSEFAADMRLIFENCYRFNPPGHTAVEMANKLEKVFETQFANIPAYHSGNNSSSDSDQDERIEQLDNVLQLFNAFGQQLNNLVKGEKAKVKRRKLRKRVSKSSRSSGSKTPSVSSPLQSPIKSRSSVVGTPEAKRKKSAEADGQQKEKQDKPF